MDYLKKFSKDTIRKSLECKYGQKIEFRKAIKIDGKSQKVIRIKCSDVLEDRTEEVKQDEELQDIPAINIVQNLTDYIHFGDNEPSLPISDIDISRITQSPIQVSEPTTIDTNNINDIDFSKPIDEDLPF